MNVVAEKCKEMKHHPEWSNVSASLILLRPFCHVDCSYAGSLTIKQP